MSEVARVTWAKLWQTLLFITPLLVREEKEVGGRGGWSSKPKNWLANKAQGGKGVEIMVCWKLLVLFFPEPGMTIPSSESCCKKLAGWTQGLMRNLASGWNVPTEGCRLCRAPGSEHPPCLSPRSSAALVHLCPLPLGSLRLVLVKLLR